MMNYKWLETEEYDFRESFRPQQGLPMMNNMMIEVDEKKLDKLFPSPTGVTYDE